MELVVFLQGICCFYILNFKFNRKINEFIEVKELNMMIKGFGGIFWRTKNLDALKKWYSKVLNVEIESWNGTIIKPDSENETIFSFFTKDDSYFPTEQQVMLNFQVYNLDEMIKHLEKVGVPLAKEKEISEYGKFAWIKDPEGRLVELWEK